MYILGVNLSHDSSVCLLKDGELKVALALERLSRVRRGLVPRNKFVAAMSRLIDYCLETEGVSYSDIDFAIASAASAASDSEEQELLSALGLRGPKILNMPHPGHHLSHAAAAFHASGFERACALVIDAYGSPCEQGRESETALHFEADAAPSVIFKRFHSTGQHLAGGAVSDDKLTVPARLSGLGEIYRVVTLLLGFRQSESQYDDAGKTMGLAAFGTRLSSEPEMIRPTEHGLDFSDALPFLEGMNLVRREGERRFLVPRDPATPFSAFHRNLAAQVQWEFEEGALHLVRMALAARGDDTLVASGGCFLNSVLNHRIVAETGIRRLFVFPAATDDGNCFGAASYAHHVLLGNPSKPRRRFRSCGLGRSYADDEIERALRDHKLTFSVLSGASEAAAAAAAKLAEGAIIGWFNKGGEFGPRALGHRSILANPGVPNIKDRLNQRVKFRESFRPYGASVLLERARDHFDMACSESPYMLLVCRVRDPGDARLAGVTHVDGTCRLQTVGVEDDPDFLHLLLAFEKLTGFPVILNTSFNLQGMPIVETPLDAIRCYLATQMDGMVLGRYWVEPPAFPGFIPVRRTALVLSEALWKEGRAMLEADDEGARTKLVSAATGRTIQLSGHELRLLRHGNGRVSLAGIAQELNAPLDEIINSFLRFHRQGLTYWVHLREL